MIRGEDILFGVGAETTKGTAVAPSIWIPGRSAVSAGSRVNKVPVKETRATKMPSIGSEIVQKSGGGALDFNARVISLGYILKSLLGSVSSGAVASQAGAYDHVFTLLANEPEHPTLTGALSQPGAAQDYEFVRMLVTALTLNWPIDDLLNGSFEFVAESEAAHAAYTPSFGTADHYFRPQDTTVKLAANLAGLAGATAMKVREASLDISNSGRMLQHLGDVEGDAAIVGDLEVTGDFSVDYADATLHDVFTANTYKALSIKSERTDVTIGVSTFPSITIELPRITFESYDADRPIDDIVSEGIGFAAHYSISDSLGIRITLRNTQANYNA
jgi:hypothetical protein